MTVLRISPLLGVDPKGKPRLREKVRSKKRSLAYGSMG